MNARELRIGNLVYEDDNNVVLEIDEWDLTNIGTIKPIPLTEEWLVKFGFGYWEDVDEWYSPDIDATLRINHYYNNKVKNGFFESDYGVDIKHVHQLQNLYRALTGEELTIKEL